MAARRTNRSQGISAGRLTLQRNPLNESSPRPSAPPLGRVISVRGSQVTVGLLRQTSVARSTVGKFMGIGAGTSLLAGVITDVSANVTASPQEYYATANIDLVGEIKQHGGESACFHRGVTQYPAIDDPASEIAACELRLIFNVAGTSVLNIGHLQQDDSIAAYIDINDLLNRHVSPDLVVVNKRTIVERLHTKVAEVYLLEKHAAGPR